MLSYPKVQLVIRRLIKLLNVRRGLYRRELIRRKSRFQIGGWFFIYWICITLLKHHNKTNSKQETVERGIYWGEGGELLTDVFCFFLQVDGPIDGGGGS